MNQTVQKRANAASSTTQPKRGRPPAAEARTNDPERTMADIIAVATH